MQNRRYVPGTQSFDPEDSTQDVVLGCPKEDKHDQYRPVHELSIDHLPELWRTEKVLQDLKTIARRVVHLLVVKLSPTRASSFPDGHKGSGFLIFHPQYGAIVNTSKHVVWDPFEAKHTIVRLFYEDDDKINADLAAVKGIKQHILSSATSVTTPPLMINSDVWSEAAGERFMYRGSARYFKSVLCSDYTAFSCEGLPVEDLFTKEEIQASDAAFSWWNFSLKRLMFSPQVDIDVAVISHPHGGPQVVSFGKMPRLQGVQSLLYDALTCGGSGGAPVIRLHSDSVHYINAGQFVHHGHWREKLYMGTGTVRPPVALPYWKMLDAHKTLAIAVSILYEPIFYWTLVVCDLLDIKNTLHRSLDVFAYISSFCGLMLSVDSHWFKFLNCGFWFHVLLSVMVMSRAAGLYFAVCDSLARLIRMSMFLIMWALMHILPWSVSYMALVIVVWLMVLYLERYFDLTSRFLNKTVGSFPERMKHRLSTEMKIHAKRIKKEELVTAQEISTEAKDGSTS